MAEAAKEKKQGEQAAESKAEPQVEKPPSAKPTRRKYVEATEKFLTEALFKKRVTEIAPVIKMALYGRSGVGKTVFGSTLPNPLILAAESGTASIRDRMEDVTVINVTSYDDILLALEFLRKDSEHRFKSVVIDSISELQRKHMDLLLDRENTAHMSLDMYGECTNEMRRIVREFCDLDIHVLFICGVRDDKDEEVGAVVHKCGMVGRMADELPHYVDVVGHMAVRAPGPKDEDQTVKRFIVVQPLPKYDAKDRFGKLDRYMRPDFKHFVDCIFGEEEKAAAEAAPEEGAEAAAESGGGKEE